MLFNSPLEISAKRQTNVIFCRMDGAREDMVGKFLAKVFRTKKNRTVVEFLKCEPFILTISEIN